ncbi:hypothetical protein [Leptospira kanakyensis]|uniref:hypothetical protein n=1 Tax=Leptospira kanakyensis TaxID=2484968 RepID=UPI00223DEB92|nr:hypothetical protein [Leptospira kanakyensis]MCW7468201.1 hypothetical protein [Leptospira kanakyensis]MCW7482580.1 hypothetical protein [Leptospira kanakyensis]
MKNSILKPTIYILIFLSVFLIGCHEKKDNTTNNLLALYLLSGDPTDTMNLNTPLGRASATANAISSISANSTTVSNSGSFTMKNPNMKLPVDQQLLAAIHKIYQYGKDPVVAKQVMSELIAKNFPQKNGKVEKVLTAWSGATVVNGRNEYTYSGTLKGRVFEKRTTNMTLNGAACPVTAYFVALIQQSQLAEKGIAVFSNGKLSVSQTNTLGDSINKADVIFNDFGSIYTDSFAYYKELKKLNGLPIIGTCEGLQTSYALQDNFTKPVTMNGPLSFESTYLVSASFPNIRFRAKSFSNSNGLVISQGNITTPSLVIESLSYDTEVDVVSSNNLLSGTIKVTITGKINGDTLTENLSVVF